MPVRCRRRQRQQHLTLLSLGPALAAESNVGLMALTVSSQVSPDRLQPLPSGPRTRPPRPALLVKGYLTQQIDQRLGRASPVSPLSRAEVRTLARP